MLRDCRLRFTLVVPIQSLVGSFSIDHLLHDPELLADLLVIVPSETGCCLSPPIQLQEKSSGISFKPPAQIFSAPNAWQGWKSHVLLLLALLDLRKNRFRSPQTKMVICSSTGSCNLGFGPTTVSHMHSNKPSEDEISTLSLL